MPTNRREFFRRFVAFSVLGAAGVISLLELVLRQDQAEQQQGNVTTLTLGSPARQSSTNVQSTVTQEPSSQQSSTSKNVASSTQSSPKSVPAGYILVAPISALSGRNQAYFNHPNFGLSLLLSYTGKWKAFNAACTHAGCTVQYAGSSVYCPCHAGYFSPSDGSVQSGPLPSPLPEYTVLVQDSNLYVGDKVIN